MGKSFAVRVAAEWLKQRGREDVQCLSLKILETQLTNALATCLKVEVTPALSRDCIRLPGLPPARVILQFEDFLKIFFC